MLVYMPLSAVDVLSGFGDCVLYKHRAPNHDSMTKFIRIPKLV